MALWEVSGMIGTRSVELFAATAIVITDYCIIRGRFLQIQRGCQGVKGESEGVQKGLPSRFCSCPLGCRVRGQKTKGMSFQVLAL